MKSWQMGGATADYNRGESFLFTDDGRNNMPWWTTSWDQDGQGGWRRHSLPTALAVAVDERARERGYSPRYSCARATSRVVAEQVLLARARFVSRPRPLVLTGSTTTSHVNSLVPSYRFRLGRTGWIVISTCVQSKIEIIRWIIRRRRRQAADDKCGFL